MIGLGDTHFAIAVYFEHRPPIKKYLELTTTIGLTPTELEFILANTSNNWRKIFNCYAKLCFALSSHLALSPSHSSWQNLRDSDLLNQSSRFALLFNPPQFDSPQFDLAPNNPTNLKQTSSDQTNLVKTHAVETHAVETQHQAFKPIHIISGRTYADKLNLPFELTWLSPQFAINQTHRCIVSPYFDYRQLSNERLEQLVNLIKNFK